MSRFKVHSTVWMAAVVLSLLGGCPQGSSPGDGSGGGGDTAGDTGSGAGDAGGSAGGGSGGASDGSGDGGAGGGDGSGGGGSGGGGASDPGGDPTNHAPSASLRVSPAGGVAPGTSVTLDASDSLDPDGDPLTFEWSQSDGPSAALSSTLDAVVSFAAPPAAENVELRFSLAVRDSRGGQATAQAVVMIEVAAKFAGHPQSILPYREALTSDEAYHLLRRAAFGARPQDVADAVQVGLTPTVNELLSYHEPSAEVSALVDSFEEDATKRWMVWMLEGPNPLLERVALFWHDRFATSGRVATDWRDRTLAAIHMNMLRNHALGNYREFLEALTLDPLMLIWLDGANSPKQAPNENYAREFWELFTLGRDTLYTEADIREASRAFTGITLLREWEQDTRPIYDLVNHDETMKSVFPGRANPANYNYESLIDLTVAQPEAARYAARNLFVAFVHDHPSDEVITALAEQFVASGFEIAPLLRTILTSQAMFSPDALGNQVASPVEHWIGVARTLDMHMFSEDSQGYLFDQLIQDLRNAGQELLDPPGVDGWHEDLAWLEDQWIISRARALGRTMDYGPQRTPDLPYHLLPAPDTWNLRETRGQIVDAMAAVFHLELTAEERDIYVEVLDQGGWRAFHLEDPRYQPEQVFEMIRLMAMDERVAGR